MAVTFVERLPSNPTAWAAIQDAFTRLLEYVPLFLPLAIFMGTLLTSYNLTRSSERVIISAAGLSPYQISRPFLLGALIIGILATTVINPYSVHLSSEHITSDHLKLIDNEIWLRESSDSGYITMNAKHMHKSGNILLFDDATIYIQSASFKLTTRIQSDTISLSDAGLNATEPYWTDTCNLIKYHSGTCLNLYTRCDQSAHLYAGIWFSFGHCCSCH